MLESRGTYPRAGRREAVERLRRAHASGERISGEVVGSNLGGVLVLLGDSVGFVPRSQLELVPGADHRDLVGEQWRGYVLRATWRKLILTPHSPKAQRRREGRAARALERLEPGARFTARITGITARGAFARFGRAGLEGTIPRVELSWWRVRHPIEVVEPGDRLKVTVLAAHPSDDPMRAMPRIRLSLRRTEPNPWPGVAQRLHSGAEIRCRAESADSDGLWLRVVDEPRIETRVRQRDLAVPIEPGSDVIARVRGISVERGRLYVDASTVRAKSPAPG